MELRELSRELLIAGGVQRIELPHSFLDRTVNTSQQRLRVLVRRGYITLVVRAQVVDSPNLFVEVLERICVPVLPYLFRGVLQLHMHLVDGVVSVGLYHLGLILESFKVDVSGVTIWFIRKSVKLLYGVDVCVQHVVRLQVVSLERAEYSIGCLEN